MFTSLGTFLQTLADSAQTSLFLPLFVIAVLFGGVTYMFGRHGDGKQAMLVAIGGGIVFLLAKTFGTALQGMPH